MKVNNVGNCDHTVIWYMRHLCYQEAHSSSFIPFECSSKESEGKLMAIYYIEIILYV